jgi:hypothetical protein
MAGDLSGVAQIVVPKNQIAKKFLRDSKKKSNSFRQGRVPGFKTPRNS